MNVLRSHDEQPASRAGAPLADEEQHPASSRPQRVVASCSTVASLYSTYSQLFVDKRLRSTAQASFLGRCCASLRPRVVSQLLGEGVDKPFCVTWLGSDHVVWGTKCNKLLVHHMPSGEVSGVPLPPLPSHVEPPTRSHNDFGRCGMHSVCANPSLTLLASGGEHPNDIMVYSVPDFRPLKTLLGHNDWVFSLDFLSDWHIASGGRDGKMMLWRLDPEALHEEGSMYTRNEPLCSITLAKKRKVRESRYCHECCELLALDPSGYLRQVDVGTWRVCAKWALPEPDELICMDTYSHLVAAGSERQLILLDTRAKQPVAKMPTPHALHLVSASAAAALPDGDAGAGAALGGAGAGTQLAEAAAQGPAFLVRHHDQMGLRSVRLNSTVVSCGGAFGTLAFYDLIAGRWAARAADPAAVPPAVLPAGPALWSVNLHTPRPPPLRAAQLATLGAVLRQHLQHGAAAAATTVAVVMGNGRATLAGSQTTPQAQGRVVDGELQQQQQQQQQEAWPPPPAPPAVGWWLQGAQLHGGAVAERRQPGSAEAPQGAERRRQVGQAERHQGGGGWLQEERAPAPAPRDGGGGGGGRPAELQPVLTDQLRFFTANEAAARTSEVFEELLSQLELQNNLLASGLDYMSHVAIYAQAWDPSGRRLVTGGGPLAIGLRGCYAALWT